MGFLVLFWPSSANAHASAGQARIAQLVEHSTDTRKVLGSTPSARTNTGCLCGRRHDGAEAGSRKNSAEFYA